MILGDSEVFKQNSATSAISIQSCDAFDNSLKELTGRGVDKMRTRTVDRGPTKMWTFARGLDIFSRSTLVIFGSFLD